MINAGTITKLGKLIVDFLNLNQYARIGVWPELSSL